MYVCVKLELMIYIYIFFFFYNESYIVSNSSQINDFIFLLVV